VKDGEGAEVNGTFMKKNGTCWGGLVDTDDDFGV